MSARVCVCVSVAQQERVRHAGAVSACGQRAGGARPPDDGLSYELAVMKLRAAGRAPLPVANGRRWRMNGMQNKQTSAHARAPPVNFIIFGRRRGPPAAGARKRPVTSAINLCVAPGAGQLRKRARQTKRRAGRQVSGRRAAGGGHTGRPAADTRAPGRQAATTIPRRLLMKWPGRAALAQAPARPCKLAGGQGQPAPARHAWQPGRAGQ